MRKIFLLILFLTSVSHAQISPANNQDWDCDDNGALGPNNDVLSEERGRIGTTEVCVIEGNCLKGTFIGFFSNPVKIKTYCRANRSNRCPVLQACADSKEIARADISKIRFYNTERCNSSSSLNTSGSTSKKSGAAK